MPVVLERTQVSGSLCSPFCPVSTRFRQQRVHFQIPHRGFGELEQLAVSTLVWVETVLTGLWILGWRREPRYNDPGYSGCMLESDCPGYSGSLPESDR